MPEPATGTASVVGGMAIRLRRPIHGLGPALPEQPGTKISPADTARSDQRVRLVGGEERAINRTAEEKMSKRLERDIAAWPVLFRGIVTGSIARQREDA